MKVLVVGATGAVGLPLVSRLAERGHAVVGTSRTRERAEMLRRRGAEPAVLDVLDREAARRLLRETRPDVIVHEATRTAGFGAELSALVQERCFYHLEAPVQRATGWDTPYPHSLEWAYFPGPIRLGTAFKNALED